MKTSKIILIFASVALFFIGLTVYNLVINNKRTFKMINIPKYEMCFLVSSDYKIEKTDMGFKYSLKNNYGEFKLLNRSMSEDLVTATVGDVEAGYKKLKNDRIFEYKLDEEHVLLDDFIIIKKMQPNLVPLKSKCAKLLEIYPTIMEL